MSALRSSRREKQQYSRQIGRVTNCSKENETFEFSKANLDISGLANEQKILLKIRKSSKPITSPTHL